MKQYTFSSEPEFIEGEIDKIAERENRSRSEIIDLLLRRAIKERKRKRNVKEIKPENNR
jgi:metal-responsive CopG/Arc/MetJ family transcriptional regulator